jgi:hypothetical protein
MKIIADGVIQADKCSSSARSARMTVSDNTSPFLVIPNSMLYSLDITKSSQYAKTHGLNVMFYQQQQQQQHIVGTAITTPALLAKSRSDSFIKKRDMDQDVNAA